MHELVGHILVGADESTAGRQALRWALDLRARTGATVEAVRSWSYPGVFVRSLPSVDEMDATVAAELEAAVAAQTGTAGADGVTTTVSRGPADQALLDLQRRHHAALVVLGRRGDDERGSARLLGSVGRRLVAQAPCPVVVVSPEAAAGLERIVVGVDGSANSQQAARWAGRLAAAVGGEVIVVYAVGFGLGTVPQNVEAVMENGNRIADETVTLLAESGVTARATTAWGDPRHSLEDVATDHDAGLIVVGTRGAGALSKLVVGSVASYLAEHADRPVAVVPVG